MNDMKFTTAGDMMKEEHRMYPEIDENNVGEFFRFVPNPEDQNDKQYCLEILDVPLFDGTIFKFLQVQLSEEYDDGTVDMNFTYDVKYVPESFDVDKLTKDDKMYFENLLSQILRWLLIKQSEQANNNEQD